MLSRSLVHTAITRNASKQPGFRPRSLLRNIPLFEQHSRCSTPSSKLPANGTTARELSPIGIQHTPQTLRHHPVLPLLTHCISKPISRHYTQNVLPITLGGFGIKEPLDYLQKIGVDTTYFPYEADTDENATKQLAMQDQLPFFIQPESCEVPRSRFYRLYKELPWYKRCALAFTLCCGYVLRLCATAFNWKWCLPILNKIERLLPPVCFDVDFNMALSPDEQKYANHLNSVLEQLYGRIIAYAERFVNTPGLHHRKIQQVEETHNYDRQNPNDYLITILFSSSKNPEYYYYRDLLCNYLTDREYLPYHYPIYTQPGILFNPINLEIPIVPLLLQYAAFDPLKYQVYRQYGVPRELDAHLKDFKRYLRRKTSLNDLYVLRRGPVYPTRQATQDREVTPHPPSSAHSPPPSDLDGPTFTFGSNQSSTGTTSWDRNYDPSTSPDVSGDHMNRTDQVQHDIRMNETHENSAPTNDSIKAYRQEVEGPFHTAYHFHNGNSARYYALALHAYPEHISEDAIRQYYGDQDSWMLLQAKGARGSLDFIDIVYDYFWSFSKHQQEVAKNVSPLTISSLEQIEKLKNSLSTDALDDIANGRKTLSQIVAETTGKTPLMDDLDAVQNLFIEAMAEFQQEQQQHKQKIDNTSSRDEGMDANTSQQPVNTRLKIDVQPDSRTIYDQTAQKTITVSYIPTQHDGKNEQDGGKPLNRIVKNYLMNPHAFSVLSGNTSNRRSQLLHLHPLDRHATEREKTTMDPMKSKLIAEQNLYSIERDILKTRIKQYIQNYHRTTTAVGDDHSQEARVRSTPELLIHPDMIENTIDIDFRLVRRIKEEREQYDFNLYESGLKSTRSMVEMSFMCDPLDELSAIELLDLFDLLSAHQAMMLATGVDSYDYADYLLQKDKIMSTQVSHSSETPRGTPRSKSYRVAGFRDMVKAFQAMKLKKVRRMRAIRKKKEQRERNEAMRGLTRRQREQQLSFHGGKLPSTVDSQQPKQEEQKQQTIPDQPTAADLLSPLSTFDDIDIALESLTLRDHKGDGIDGNNDGDDDDDDDDDVDLVTIVPSLLLLDFYSGGMTSTTTKPATRRHKKPTSPPSGVDRRNRPDNDEDDDQDIRSALLYDDDDITLFASTPQDKSVSKQRQMRRSEMQASRKQRLQYNIDAEHQPTVLLFTFEGNDDLYIPDTISELSSAVEEKLAGSDDDQAIKSSITTLGEPEPGDDTLQYQYPMGYLRPPTQADEVSTSIIARHLHGLFKSTVKYYNNTYFTWMYGMPEFPQYSTDSFKLPETLTNSLAQLLWEHEQQTEGLPYYTPHPTHQYSVDTMLFYRRHCNRFIFSFLQHMLKTYLVDKAKAFLQIYNLEVGADDNLFSPTLSLVDENNKFKYAPKQSDGMLRYTIASEYYRHFDPLQLAIDCYQLQLTANYENWKSIQAKKHKESSNVHPFSFRKKRTSRRAAASLENTEFPIFTPHEIASVKSDMASHLNTYLAMIAGVDKPLNPAAVEQIRHSLFHVLQRQYPADYGGFIIHNLERHIERSQDHHDNDDDDDVYIPIGFGSLSSAYCAADLAAKAGGSEQLYTHRRMIDEKAMSQIAKTAAELRHESYLENPEYRQLLKDAYGDEFDEYDYNLSGYDDQTFSKIESAIVRQSDALQFPSMANSRYIVDNYHEKEQRKKRNRPVHERISENIHMYEQFRDEYMASVKDEQEDDDDDSQLFDLLQSLYVDGHPFSTSFQALSDEMLQPIHIRQELIRQRKKKERAQRSQDRINSKSVGGYLFHNTIYYDSLQKRDDAHMFLQAIWDLYRTDELYDIGIDYTQEIQVPDYAGPKTTDRFSPTPILERYRNQLENDRSSSGSTHRINDPAVIKHRKRHIEQLKKYDGVVLTNTLLDPTHPNSLAIGPTPSSLEVINYSEYDYPPIKSLSDEELREQYACDMLNVFLAIEPHLINGDLVKRTIANIRSSQYRPDYYTRYYQQLYLPESMKRDIGHLLAFTHYIQHRNRLSVLSDIQKELETAFWRVAQSDDEHHIQQILRKYQSVKQLYIDPSPASPYKPSTIVAIESSQTPQANQGIAATPRERLLQSIREENRTKPPPTIPAPERLSPLMQIRFLDDLLNESNLGLTGLGRLGHTSMQFLPPRPSTGVDFKWVTTNDVNASLKFSSQLLRTEQHLCEWYQPLSWL